MTSAERLLSVVRRLDKTRFEPLLAAVFRGLAFLDGVQIAWSRPAWKVPPGAEKNPIFQGPGPIVISGTGGSGTRVLAAALRDAGCYLGDTMNIAHDCTAFTGMWGRRFNPEILKGVSGRMLRPDELFGASLPRYVARHTRPLSDAERATLVDDLLRRLAWLLRNRPTPTTPWGWKFPASINFLPLLNEVFPEMRFVHLVRDGRDMAFSTNQVRVASYTPILLDPEAEGLPEPVRSAMLWNRMNVDAALYGQAVMKERYLVIRFEDLCADPGRELARLWSFMGFRAAVSPEVASRAVSYDGGLGRWRACADQELVREVSRRAEPGLRMFGYWPERELSDTMPSR